MCQNNSSRYLFYGILTGITCWLLGFLIVFDQALLTENGGKLDKLPVPSRTAIDYFIDFSSIFLNNFIVALIITFLGYFTFGILSLLISLYNGIILGLIINSFLKEYSKILLTKVLFHVPLEILAFSCFCSYGLLGVKNLGSTWRNQNWSFAYLPKPKSFIYPVIFLLGAAFIEADIHTFLYLIFFNL